MNSPYQTIMTLANRKKPFIKWPTRTRIRCKTFDWSGPIFYPMSFDFIINAKFLLHGPIRYDLASYIRLPHNSVSCQHMCTVSCLQCQLWARGQTVSSVRWHRYQGPGSRDQLRHPEPGSLIQPCLALIIDRSGEGWSLHYYFTNDLVQIISSIKGDYRELSSLAKSSKC